MTEKSTALVQQTGIYEVDFFPKDTVPGRSLLLQNFIPHLPEVGKIKIGRKGKWVEDGQGNKRYQQPEKLKNFLITTLDRDDNNNLIVNEQIHKLLGDTTKDHDGLKIVPIRLPYISLPLNFQSRFSCYKGKSLLCSGNGIKAQRNVGTTTDPFLTKTIDCPCSQGLPGYEGKDVCKFTCRLTCLVKGIKQVGGVWIFRSTSYNTTKNIQSALMYINLLTQGVMNGIDLELFLIPKSVPSVDKNGKVVNRKILTVAVRYAGEEQELVGHGEKYRIERHDQFIMAHRLESETQKLLTGTFEFGEVMEADENNSDIVEEFYPEQAEAAGPPEEKKKKKGRPAKQKEELPKTETVDKKTGEVTEPDPPQMKTEEAQFEEVQEEPNVLTGVPLQEGGKTATQEQMKPEPKPEKEPEKVDAPNITDNDVF